MDTSNTAACSKCLKTLTGKWNLHPRGNCKTGRLTEINGFIRSDSPNWISSYCEPCWNEMEEQVSNLEELLDSYCKDKEENNAESKKLVEEIQRLTETNMKTDNELNSKMKNVTQERDNLKQQIANLNSKVELNGTEFQNKLRALEKEKNALIKDLKERLKKVEDEKKEQTLEIQRLFQGKQITDKNLKKSVDDIVQERDAFKQNEAKNRSKIENLFEDKQTRDKELEVYKKKVEDLQQERDSYKQEKDKNLASFNNEIQSRDTEFQNKLRALEKEKNTFIENLEERLKKVEDEKKEQTLKIQSLIQGKQTIEEELKSSNERINSLKRENTSLTDKSNQIESQNRALKNSLEELENKIRQSFRFKEKRINPENFKDFYDCRIIADSFYALLNNNSWSIEYNNFQKCQELKTKNTTKVAALGYENTGKSFVISKLTGSELPQGLFMKTVGICLKFPTGERLPWTALDTPGTNISIKTEEMKKHLADYFEGKKLSNAERIRMLLGDNILIENLLQEFVVKHAQVLLVVIGKLRRDDQKLVNRIKNLSRKRIIIVHNLSDAHSKEDVNEIIKEDILNTFAVTEKPIYLEQIEAGRREGMNQKVYLENEIVGEKAIEHIVMAHEGSPAGDYYNESAISYIKTLITSIPHNQPFDLTQAFLTHLNENLNYYLHSKITEGERPFILENDAIKLNDCIRYDLKLSSADEFGQIRTFAREGLDDISYTVKIVNEKTDAGAEGILKIDLELAGQYEENNIRFRVHHLSDDQVSIEIKGKSEDNTIREANEQILENHRKFGEFNIRTDSINLNGLSISLVDGCRKIRNQVPGILTLTWNLYKPAE